MGSTVKRALAILHIPMLSRSSIIWFRAISLPPHVSSLRNAHFCKGCCACKNDRFVETKPLVPPRQPRLCTHMSGLRFAKTIVFASGTFGLGVACHGRRVLDVGGSRLSSPRRSVLGAPMLSRSSIIWFRGISLPPHVRGSRLPVA